jgi:CHAD domain-containing protein
MSQAEDATPAVSAADVLAPQWRSQVADLRAWEAQVRLEHPEAVHRFRVAARRLRSNLTAFTPLLQAAAVTELRAGLQQAAAAVSDARNAEVVAERVDRLLADLPSSPGGPDTAGTRARLAALLGASYRESWEGSVDHLESEGYDELTRRLERFADLPPWLPRARRPAPEVLAPVLREEWRRFRKRGRLALGADTGADHEERIHDARKAAKRVRYVSDSVVGVFGRRAKRLAKAAAKVQVVLGDYNDGLVTRSLLREAAGHLRDAEDVRVLALLASREETAAAAARADYARVFADADRRSLRRWML